MYKICSRTAVVAAVLVLAACSEAPKPASTEKEAEAKQPAGPPVPVSAKTAYWETYTQARSWATDLVPLKVSSKEVPGVKNDAGKAGMWEIIFASPSKQEYRIFTDSVVASPPDIYKGVVIGRPMPWGGPTRDAMPFRFSEIAVDSDAAYKTARAQAEPWLQKHPDKQVSMELWNGYRFQTPMWYLLWGNNKIGYAAFVDAKTGTMPKTSSKPAA